MLGLQVLQAKAVSRSWSIEGQSIQCEIFRSRSDRSGLLETAVADTGCSYSICSQSIVSDLNIPVIPLKNSLTIVDTASQRLNIIGASVIWFSCKVLKRQKKRVKEVIWRGKYYNCWPVSRIGIWFIVPSPIKLLSISLEKTIINKVQETSILYSKQKSKQKCRKAEYVQRPVQKG